MVTSDQLHIIHPFVVIDETTTVHAPGVGMDNVDDQITSGCSIGDITLDRFNVDKGTRGPFHT